MKASPIFAAILALTSITASAQDANPAAPGASLMQGDRFVCSPSMPRAGVAVANTLLLTCTVDHDVKSKAGQTPAIHAKSKLVGNVQGQKVTWSQIVSEKGESTDLAAKDGAVMVSKVKDKTLPRTLTVHVMRDLVFN